MRCMHFDDMVEGEQRERDPYRRRRGGAHFEDGESDDPQRQDYLQVDTVVRGDSDLAVALRMAGQELGLFLDPARKLVDVRERRCTSARLLDVILEAAMELVMA